MSVATLLHTPDGLRDVHGRGMNIHSDFYKLPADAEEHDRLTLQHRIWKLLYGGKTGLFPPEVEDIINRLLSSNPSSDRNGSNATASPAVLDLGSGSGIWVAEMAAVYLYVKVVGLDLAEPNLQKSLFPPNCSFVTTDLTKGLDEYRESFDVVHCRCVAGHLRDRIQLMHEIVKVLKPGGLLLIGDGNLHLYKSDKSRVSPAPVSPPSTTSPSHSSSANNNEEESWTTLWLEQVISRQLKATLDPEHAGGEQIGWLVQQESQLSYLGERAYFCPLRPGRRRIAKDENGTDVEREKEEELGRLMRKNISNFLEASKPILLKDGVSPETVDQWLTRARSELMKPDPEAEETWFFRWDMAWAVKKVASEKL